MAGLKRIYIPKRLTKSGCGGGAAATSAAVCESIYLDEAGKVVPACERSYYMADKTLGKWCQVNQERRKSGHLAALD